MVTGEDRYDREVARALVVACDELAPRLCDAPVVAATMVRNESDIIERFVRHALSWADALLVVDHSSSDGTREILEALRGEGLAVGIADDRAFGFHQSTRMTEACRMAGHRLGAVAVIPIDADEFLVDSEFDDPGARLRAMSVDGTLAVRWRSFVPTPDDDPDEPDVLRRIAHHLERQPEKGPGSIILGGDLARARDMRITHGNHRVFVGTRRIDGGPLLEGAWLAHYPVRSTDQFASKIAAKVLSTPFAPERSPSAGWLYGRIVQRFPDWWQLSASQLMEIASSYFDRDPVPSPPLVRNPTQATREALLYGGFAHCDPIKTVFDIAVTMTNRLGEARDGLVEYTFLDRPITAENALLRKSLNEVASALGINAHDLSAEAATSAVLARIADLQRFQRAGE